MQRFLSVLQLFPKEHRERLKECIRKEKIYPEEIRVRLGMPVVLRTYGREVMCGDCVTKEDLLYLIGNATECSYYKARRYMAHGYIPLQGGCRMGLCGMSGEDGGIDSMGAVTSVCIRIASEAMGCADDIYPALTEPSFCSTIIIAPPGAGKTTLLRELIRKLSVEGFYVGIADERGEITGQRDGVCAFDLGPRYDVLTDVPKSKGAMMLLRAMSPQVIAMDEITAHGDMDAVTEAVGCGVGLLTTMHGDGVRALKRPAFAPLYECGAFEKAVLIGMKGEGRMYEVVSLYD